MADIDVTYTPGDEPEEQEETSQREKLLNDSQFMADAYSFITKRTSEIPKTDDEVYDKFMEHMRFHETNEVTAVRDLMYAQESDQQSREEFARLLQRWDESEGDPMSWTKAMDYVEAGITAPSTWVGLISGGTGKVTGQAAVQAAKTGLRAYLTKEVGKGMVKGALAEGAIGLGTGAAQEGTRVETGAQEEFTGERTVTSALTQGAFGAIPGGIGGFQQGTRRLEASQLRQSYEAARGAKAEAAEKKVRSVISDAKKNNPTVVEKTKGEILTGTVIQARKFLEESKLRALPEERVREGLELLAGMTESEKIAASLSDDVLERVTAATIELGKKVKPEPGERITETIGRYIEEGKVGDQSINEFLDEFNLSQREFNSIFVAELSRAGQTLSRASKVSRAVKGTKTAKQRTEEQQKILNNVVNAFEEFDATIGFGVNRETALAITSQAKKQTAQDTWLQNFDRLRLSMMTAQLATTVRNTAGGAFRVAVDVVDKGSRNIISRSLGRTDEITESPLAISNYLLFNQAEAKLIKQLFEENLPKEAGEFYGAFLETATVSSRVANTSVMNKVGASVNMLNRLPFTLSLIMPFPRFVINQLSFVSQNMPVLGLAASKALGKNVTDTDALAKQVTGMGLLSSAYYMRAQAGTDSEWYHVKTAEGDLVDVRAIAGPMNAFLLAADVLYRTNAGGKLSALLAGKNMKEVPDDEVMSTLEGMKAGWQALGGPAFRAGTGLAGIDRLIEEMNAESGVGLKTGIVAGTFAGDMINTFTLPLATARDIMSLTDAEARQLPEGNYTNGWDIFAIRATRSLPTLESASLSEWISSNAGTGIVGEKEERIDILTGEPMRYIDPLERQIFGVSKVAEPNELQKEMMRLQIRSYDLFNPADYPEEERLIRELAAPAIAERLNTYVLSDEYAELEDQPKIKKGVLRQKVQEIIQEYRPQVRERIEVEQQAAVQPGESTESDRFAFEKIPSRDRAIIMEQYELQYDRPMGEDFRGALELWEESIKPRMKRMAEGGFVTEVSDQMDQLGLMSRR